MERRRSRSTATPATCPEAVLNHLALLGWSLDGETTIISPQTLCANFTLDRVSKNPAIFDVEKLDWMNGVYIRGLGPDGLRRPDDAVADAGGSRHGGGDRRFAATGTCG